MQIPHSVARTVKEIQKKIDALEETKQRLLETFSVQQTPPRRRSGSADAMSIVQSSGAGRGTSAVKLENFLKTNGAATRQEIMDNAGIPRGSVSYLLNLWEEKGRARRRLDNKWELVA